MHLKPFVLRLGRLPVAAALFFTMTLLAMADKTPAILSVRVSASAMTILVQNFPATSVDARFNGQLLSSTYSSAERKD